MIGTAAWGVETFSLAGGRRCYVKAQESTSNQTVLTNLTIFARHGLSAEETKFGQRFYVDVVASARLRYAERKEEAERTINYADLVDVTTRAFTERRHKLVEAAAPAIAHAAHARFNRVERVRVGVLKPSAPIEAAHQLEDGGRIGLPSAILKSMAPLAVAIGTVIRLRA